VFLLYVGIYLNIRNTIEWGVSIEI
jgi:hypothetical protein